MRSKPRQKCSNFGWTRIVRPQSQTGRACRRGAFTPPWQGRPKARGWSQSVSRANAKRAHPRPATQYEGGGRVKSLRAERLRHARARPHVTTHTRVLTDMLTCEAVSLAKSAAILDGRASCARRAKRAGPAGGCAFTPARRIHALGAPRPNYVPAQARFRRSPRRADRPWPG